ncbi:NACHT domain-containing protein, partial [Listeria monocytogenes]|nr:NACHT domain-containing protein [Listeria monocytogenes]
EDIYSWYWKQKATLIETGDILTLKNIVEMNQNIALIGKAGTGKTTFFHRMFIKLCEAYLEGTSKEIPVFLSAKLWKRDFSTLIEGIFSELKIFLPQLTVEILENEIATNKIVLLVDGIDECFSDRDVLLHEINNFSCRTILSTREHTATGRLSGFCYFE